MVLSESMVDLIHIQYISVDLKLNLTLLCVGKISMNKFKFIRSINISAQYTKILKLQYKINVRTRSSILITKEISVVSSWLELYNRGILVYTAVRQYIHEHKCWCNSWCICWCICWCISNIIQSFVRCITIPRMVLYLFAAINALFKYIEYD